jgi:hypothetical protein
MLQAMSDRRSHPSRWFVLVLMLLAGAHTAIALSAAYQKSPTFDEPLHLVGAWSRLALDDYRINPEDPPLFHRWMALAIDADDLRLPSDPLAWDRILTNVEFQWQFVHPTLYRDPNVDAHALTQRARQAMVVWSGLLVLVIGVGGFAIGASLGLRGESVGLVAAAMVAFDPNVLAHGPLLKNDVALTTCFAALIPVLWLVLQRVTLWRTVLLAGVVTLCLLIKFSGVLALPIVAAALGVRAVTDGPWAVGSSTTVVRWRKAVLAATLMAVCGLVGWAGIWTAYGFRHRATADGTPLDFQTQIEETQRRRLEARQGKMIFPEDWALVDPSMRDPEPTAERMARLGGSGLVPEAWAFGLLHVHARSLSRPSFLLGESGFAGWWYYYPAAFALKTPVGTLVLTLAAMALGATTLRRWTVWGTHRRLAAIAVLTPGAVYLAFAMNSAMNIGIRHLLPVYPTIALATAMVLVRRASSWRRGLVILLLALGAIEALARYPHFIAFFNLATGGTRGGLMALGDSNLDWGQDLPLLAQWQRENPDTTLYLTYFGSADPLAYGIRYRNVPPGYAFNDVIDRFDRDQPGVLAVSASTLQTTFSPDLRRAFEKLRDVTPREVLGGSIYLYDWPFRDQGD